MIYHPKNQNQKVNRKISKENFSIYLIHQVIYKITIVTSSENESSTDSGVFMTIYGENGQTKQFQLTNQNPDSLFQKGNTDQFEIELNDVGNVSLIDTLRILYL